MDAADKMKIRDELRVSNFTSPQISDLNREIEVVIKKHKQAKWREKIESLGKKTDTGKLFKIIKSLNGQPPIKDNQGIKFKGKYLSSAKDLANAFNKQYTSAVRHTSSKESRKTTKAMRRNPLSEATSHNVEAQSVWEKNSTHGSH